MRETTVKEYFGLDSFEIDKAKRYEVSANSIEVRDALSCRFKSRFINFEKN